MNNKNITEQFEKIAEGKNIESQEDFGRVFDEFMKNQKNFFQQRIREGRWKCLWLFETVRISAEQKTSLKTRKKALELEPDNIDAQIAVAELTANSNESLIGIIKVLIVIAQVDITKKWTGRRRDWGEIHSQLEVFFADRLPE